MGFTRGNIKQMGLGSLIARANYLAGQDRNVILGNRNDVPERSRNNWKLYRAIIDEINERERDYRSLPADVRKVVDEHRRY